MFRGPKIILVVLIISFLLAVSGCAAGPDHFVERPAGFLAGLWHGFIAVVTFIISLFTKTVWMYEKNNSGAWYDLGFLLGMIIMLGGCGSKRLGKKRIKKSKEREWEEIGVKVEEKVRRGIKSWLEEAEEKDREWEEIGRKIEEKIKRELRDWAES